MQGSEQLNKFRSVGAEVNEIKLPSLGQEAQRMIDSFHPNNEVLTKSFTEISKKIIAVKESSSTSSLEKLPFIGSWIKDGRQKMQIESLKDAKTLIESLSKVLDQEEAKLSNANKQLRNLFTRLEESVRLKKEEIVPKLKSRLNEIESEILVLVDEEEMGEHEKAAALGSFNQEKMFLVDAIKRKLSDTMQHITADQVQLLSIRNIVEFNTKLIENVQRTRDHSLNTIAITAWISYYQEQQKQTLELVEVVNKESSSMLLDMTNTLANTGAEIIRKNSSSLIDNNELNKAIQNCVSFLNKFETMMKESSLLIDKALKESEQLEKSFNDHVQLGKNIYLELPNNG